MICRGKNCKSRISIVFDCEKIFCIDGKFTEANTAMELENIQNFRCFHQHSEKMCLGQNFDSYGSIIHSVVQSNDNACKITSHSESCQNMTERDILLKRIKENRQKLALAQPGVLRAADLFDM